MYFLFSYVETVLTESVAIPTVSPGALIAPLALPTAASSGAAVVGVPFWNAFDATNGNSLVWSSKKVCWITNNDAADSVDVTFKTVNGTVAGGALDSIVEDYTIRIAPKGAAFVSFLPAIFKDGTVVKISIAEVSAGAAIVDCKIAVVSLG